MLFGFMLHFYKRQGGVNMMESGSGGLYVPC